VKWVGFKSAVKERELWMSRVVNKKEEEVMGEALGESEIEELVPE